QLFTQTRSASGVCGAVARRTASADDSHVCRRSLRQRIYLRRRRGQRSATPPSLCAPRGCQRLHGVLGTNPALSYCSAFSIAPVISADSGVTLGSNRAITFPLRSSRNFVKFHWISPAVSGFASLLVRN